MREFGADPKQAFPGHGQMKPESQEIERLRREVHKLKAERDILKRPPPSSRRKRHEAGLHREAPEYLANFYLRRGHRYAMRWACRGRAFMPG